MLKAQQAAIDANPDYEFYNLNIDAGGMWVRRLIERMLDAEGRLVPPPSRLIEGQVETHGSNEQRGLAAGQSSRSQPSPTDIQRIVLEPALPRAAEPGSHIDVKVTHRRGGGEAFLFRGGVRTTARRLAISVMQGARSPEGARSSCTRWSPGQQLEITQPLQNFPLRVGRRRYVLLAGGIGMTAIANMAAVLHGSRPVTRSSMPGAAAPPWPIWPSCGSGTGNLVVHVDDEGTSLKVDELVAGADLNGALHVRADPSDGRRPPGLVRARARSARTCATRPSATAAGSTRRSSS